MQDRSWDVVVVGGINSDFTVRGPSLPAAGQTIDGEQFVAATGGKGANQAVAAARLGARTAFVGMVGRDDRGPELIRALQAEGVNTEHVQQSDHAASGVALIMVDHDGEKQIMTAPGANRRLTPDAIHVSAITALIRSARVLLLQLEVPVETALAAASIAHEAGVKVVLDPAPPVPLPDDLLKQVDLIRPNGHEAQVITGVEATDEASARHAAKRLMMRGVGAAVIGAGDAGNLAVWHDGERMLQRLKVETVDATGAGDAFAAALAVRLSEGADVARAALFGNAAAALATTKLGAQVGLPRREAVDAMLNEIA